MAINIFFFFSVFLVVSGISTGFISIPAAKADAELKETKISFYFHDLYSNVPTPNATSVAVVGFPGEKWTYAQFGTLFVIDNLVTDGPKLTSPTVGRLQGTYVTASLDGRNLALSSSLVFTNEAYNGSTIQIAGTANQFDFLTEYGVASGTGKFRYAKGYVTLEIISRDRSFIIYTLYRMNASILHY